MLNIRLVCVYLIIDNEKAIQVYLSYVFVDAWVMFYLVSLYVSLFSLFLFRSDCLMVYFVCVYSENVMNLNNKMKL